MNIRTTVQFKVEIIKSGNFGDNWKLGDIKRVAVEEAEEALRKIMSRSPRDIRVIGKPETVNCIYTEDL